MQEVLEETLLGIYQKFLSFLVSPIETYLMMVFEWIFGGINSGLMTAFDNPILKALFLVATIISWAIFVFALPFYLLKIVKEEKRNWTVIFSCVFESLVFIALNQTLAKLCFVISSAMIAMFPLNYSVGDGALLPDFGNIVVDLALLIAMIAFLIVTVMRVGAMVIQILIAPFYVPYVLLGDHQKTSEWLLGTVAAGFTYVVQYVVFYAGIMILRLGGGGLTNLMIGCSLLMGAFTVPKALQKFGWSSGAAHTFQSTATSVSMMAMRFLPKGV